jgi:hypothetical protein
MAMGGLARTYLELILAVEESLERSLPFSRLESLERVFRNCIRTRADKPTSLGHGEKIRTGCD